MKRFTLDKRIRGVSRGLNNFITFLGKSTNKKTIVSINIYSNEAETYMTLQQNIVYTLNPNFLLKNLKLKEHKCHF